MLRRSETVPDSEDDEAKGAATDKQVSSDASPPAAQVEGTTGEKKRRGRVDSTQ